MTTRTILTAVTAVFIGVLAYGYITLNKATTAPPPDVADTTAKGFTMTQVKSHNSASSCWTTISDNVYDLTNWINQHPGGPNPILSLCGTDGTAAFTAQHGGQGRPVDELKSLYIGALIQ